MTPDLTIVVPTKDRPVLLRRAITTALEQTGGVGIEVVVVDDASDDPVDLPEDPRVRVLRSDRPIGGAGARNTGTEAARGRLVAYLDDDDELHPHFAEASATALERSDLPPPVGVLSALEAVDPDGRVLETKLPQPSIRGAYYGLEDPQPGRSVHAKQTLLVGTDVLRSIGGWDPAFRSRVHTELFLRLGRRCSLDAVDTPTYRLLVHPGPRVSKDPLLRQRSFQQLLDTHADAFASRPRGAARFHLDHAEQSWRDARHATAVWSLGTAVRLAPATAGREVAGRALHRWRAVRC